MPALAAPAPVPWVAVVEDGRSFDVERVEARTPEEAAFRVDVATGGADILALAPDTRAHVSGDSGDPLRSSQWALDQVTFEAARAAVDTAGVVVAVIDTGVDASHEDLAGAVLPGWDFVRGVPGGDHDPYGHGTHVAGIVAATAGNGLGVAGAAPGVRILPVRVLGDDGYGWTSDIAKGIRWAADQGADVINLSLGGTSGAGIYRSAIDYAVNTKGAVVVAAAGNEYQDGNPVEYPAADPDTLAVGATTSKGQRAWFSNTGTYVDLAAPGSSIIAPCPVLASICGDPSGYRRLSGTSMATPYVAAAAALLRAAHPDASPRQVRTWLESTATDAGAPGPDVEFGAGIVSPLAALTAGDAVPPPSEPTPPSTPPPPPAPVAPEPAPVAPEPAPVAPDPPAPAPVAAPGGYWVVGSDGRVSAFGSAVHYGDLNGVALSAPVVAAATTPSGDGYWMAGADGGVYAFGGAPFLGSMAGTPLNQAIVGMAATRSGQGYWLLGGDGGIFSFGDAAFFGSTGGIRLNRPVVDMAPTPSGLGYWLVASDGGVFSFGDAAFFGSTGGIRLNRPVTSLAPAQAGGYWLIASDGGIFAFGVPFLGSLPGLGTPTPEGRRIRATGSGDGYYILGADGSVFTFGAAPGFGSARLPAADLLLAL
jgi:type VII secretion-associated serine protease mycosin